MSEIPDFNTDGFQDAPMSFADTPEAIDAGERGEEMPAAPQAKGKKGKKVKASEAITPKVPAEPRAPKAPKEVRVTHIGNVAEFMGEGAINIVIASVSGRDYEWDSGQQLAPWLIRRNYNGEILSANAQALLTICQMRPKYRTLQRRVAAVAEWLTNLNIENDRARARAATYISDLSTGPLEGEPIFEAYVEKVLSFSEALLAFSEMASVESTSTTKNDKNEDVVETVSDRTEIITKWEDLKTISIDLANTGFDLAAYVKVDAAAVEGE